MRRSLAIWALAVAAFLALFCGPSSAFFPLRGATASSASDALQTLIAGMSSGQSIRLNYVSSTSPYNIGMAADMAVNQYSGASLISYFDGGSTFNTGFLPNNAPQSGVGSGYGSTLGGAWHYTRLVLDYNDMKALLWGQGHDGGGDGTGYVFDLLSAAAAINANPTAKTHYSIGFKSARYIPEVMTEPAGSGVNPDPNAVKTTTATWTAGTTSMSLGDFNWSCPNSGGICNGRLWISGTGIADYTYISNTNSNTNPVTVANDNVAAGSILSGSGATISISQNYWTTTNEDGASAPISSHSYWNNTWLVGTDSVILGGGFAFGLPPGHEKFARHFDLATDTLTTETSCPTEPTSDCFGAQSGGGYEPVHYCPADGNYYTYGDTHLYQVTNLTTNPTKTAVTVTGAPSTYVYAVQTVMFMDPGDPTKCDLWQQLSANRNGTETWGMFQGIGPGSTPAWVTGTMTGFPTGAFNKNQTYFSDGSYDAPGKNILVWEGDGTVYKVTPTTGSTWATTTYATETSGDTINCLPTQDEENNSGFDLGSKYSHALLLWSGDGGGHCDGDLFLLKP